MLLLVVILLTLSGCTKYISDDNKKRVVYEVTGQSLPSNILCRAEDENTVKLYEDNGIEMSKLPKCSEFKITSGGYEGIWTTIFVKPLAWVILKLGGLVKNYGLSIIIITILIRLTAQEFKYIEYHQ